MNYFLYVQEWTESESGWGVRPDGICVAWDKTVLKNYTETHLAHMRAYEKDRYKGQTPPEYSFPDGEMSIVECSKAVFESVPETDIRWFSRTSELKA